MWWGAKRGQEFVWQRDNFGDLYNSYTLRILVTLSGTEDLEVEHLGSCHLENSCDRILNSALTLAAIKTGYYMPCLLPPYLPS